MKTKKIALFLAGVIAGLLAVVLGYVLYMVIQFYRIEDNLTISAENNQTEIASASGEFSVLTSEQNAKAHIFRNKNGKVTKEFAYDGDKILL